MMNPASFYLDILVGIFPTDTPQHFSEAAEGLLSVTRPANLTLVRRRLIHEAHLRFSADAAGELEDFFTQWVNPNPAPAPTA